MWVTDDMSDCVIVWVTDDMSDCVSDCVIV